MSNTTNPPVPKPKAMTARGGHDDDFQPLGAAAFRAMTESRWGKSEMTLMLEESRDAALLTTGCLFCEWVFEGSAVEGRLASVEHRRVAHPARVKQPRRDRRKPKAAA